MGLAERRAMTQFQETMFPKFKTAINESAGFDVMMEIDWNSLAAEGYPHLYETALPKIFFEPLTTAFKAITIDAMGKDALKKGLKKVIIKGDSASHSSWTFENGILNLPHYPCSNVDDVADRTKALTTILENGL